MTNSSGYHLNTAEYGDWYVKYILTFAFWIEVFQVVSEPYSAVEHKR
jgi:hypothetical protein